jgi:S-formylglutathione hydrolase FrmB
MHTLMILAMAATYDPDPDSPYGIRLPVDLNTCELDETRWSRWLEHDPLVLVERPECQDNLRRLSGIFIDCGRNDQYTLHYGARAFVHKLERLGIPHSYEEFDDNHSNIDYRLDVSLPFLYGAVTRDAG